LQTIMSNLIPTNVVTDPPAEGGLDRVINNSRKAHTSRVYLQTFGCQMNDRDSERILGMLAKDGYVAVDSPEDADLILLNT